MAGRLSNAEENGWRRVFSSISESDQKKLDILYVIQYSYAHITVY